MRVLVHIYDPIGHAANSFCLLDCKVPETEAARIISEDTPPAGTRIVMWDFDPIAIERCRTDFKAGNRIFELCVKAAPKK